jgi:hydrogenase-4 membrane subunit HyfE
MTHLLFTFLIVLLVPLFTATWRVSLVGLSVQGFLLGWMALRHEHAISVHATIVFLDLVVVRGLVVPRYLRVVLRRAKVKNHNDVIAANFLSWTLAGALVFGAFRFAAAVGTDATTHLAVAAAALAIGLFVLASRNTVLSQTIGILRIENAIVLFELAIAPELPLAVHCGITVVFWLTMLTLAWFFRRLIPPDPSPQAMSVEL